MVPVANHANVFRPGNVIAGKYEVIGLIGDGGMGFVVAAKHLELGEQVALKFLKPDALKNPEVVARFAREARASARIKSEYVTRVFDVGALPDGAPFIVMEHLEGEDLSSVLEKRGALPVKLVVEYVMQVCEALAAAHSIGIVHRDIKPENLFLARRSQGMDIVKVLDFGISKVALTGSAFETNQPLVRTVMPMGSPVYMSPEQIRGAEDIDARTDIWSLGCVLYELLTGATAFDAPSITQLSAIILEKHPTPIRQLQADVPADLEAVVDMCLNKDREDRYQTIADLAIALYPFAPRRARISAERCSYMLHGNAVPQAEFELISVPPPANGDLVSSQPRVTNPRVTNPRATASPKRTNPRLSSPRPMVGPAAETLPADAEESPASEPAAQPAASKSKYLAYVALGAILFGGAYAASRLFMKPATEPAEANKAQVTSEKTAKDIAAAEPSKQPETPEQTAATGDVGADSRKADNARGASSSTERSAPRRTVIAAPRRSTAAARATAKHGEEVDVGF